MRRGESADFTLSQEQVKKVLAVCKDLDERVTIGLQLFCGLRISEVVHLNSSWVTQDGNLRVPISQSCNCAECVRLRGGTWKPKTLAGARTLPIPARIRKDLVELFRTKPYGVGVARSGLYYRTKTILQRARVKYGFPLRLRATCATMLASGGMSAVNLCYFMGWKNIAIGEHHISVVKAKEGAIQQSKEIFG